MSSRKLSVWILFGLLFVALLQALYFYPKLPETVASHFGMGGRAGAWGSKTMLVVVDIGSMTLLVFIFIGLSRIPAKLLGNMMIIPDRDYWLSAERKEATVRKTANFVIWLGVLTLFFLRILFHLVYYVNTMEPPQAIQHLWLGILIYLAAVGAMTWRFYHTFYRKVT